VQDFEIGEGQRQNVFKIFAKEFAALQQRTWVSPITFGALAFWDERLLAVLSRVILL